MFSSEMAAAAAAAAGNTTKKIFVVLAKQAPSQNPFFLQVHHGCVEEAKKLGAICALKSPKNPTATEQLALLREILTAATQTATSTATSIAGLAIAPLTDSPAMALLIKEAIDELNIPVVTFDSDHKTSARLAYIGTNNYQFGQTLGKILLQLRPDGGTLAVISSLAPNLQERQQGLMDALQQRDDHVFPKNWKLVAPPTHTPDSTSVALDQMEGFLTEEPPVSAMVSVAGWPMYNATRWMNLVGRDRNVTYVVGDTFDVQIDLLQRGYVNGLVGQDPYQMGVQTIQVLNEYATASTDMMITPRNRPSMTITATQDDNIYGTAFFEMLRVPLVLPEANIDHNYVGNLRFLGFTYFGIIVLTTVLLATWTMVNSGVRVVVASQPQFLLLLCFGALVLGGSILVLSFDDSEQPLVLHDYDEETTYYQYSAYCMAFPWLAGLGFTIMFSALFSKTRCINKAFHNPHPLQRMKVSQRDLYLPLVILLLANVANMTAWTLLAPLEYVRQAHRGLDDWNRVISFYGSCQASTTNSNVDARIFVVILVGINLCALVFAIWQAYVARDIQTEFAESKYIAMAMVFVLQAVLIGAPLLALLRDTPGAFYVALTTTFFTVIMAVLLLIFIPKVRLVKQYIQNSERDRKKHLESLQVDREERRRSSLKKIGALSATKIPHGVPDDDDQPQRHDRTRKSESKNTRHLRLRVPKSVWICRNTDESSDNAVIKEDGLRLTRASWMPPEVEVEVEQDVAVDGDDPSTTLRMNEDHC